MYAIDFEYDGRHLSDYGFIVCRFNYTSGAQTASAGSKITFKTVPYHSGKKYGLVGVQYSECIQTTFDICKDPEIYDMSDRWITDDEYRDLMRWLNRSEFLKFQVINEDDRNADPCFFEGSFNIEKIKIREVLYGLRLTLTTNRPFGYGIERVHNLVFPDANTTRTIRDLSDSTGNIYPKLSILCKVAGDYTISNELTGCKTAIRNCIKKEVITIDCFNHVISTNNVAHDICNDFNYDFFSIGNTIDNRDNKISVSLPCEIELRYSPIIKDVP